MPNHVITSIKTLGVVIGVSTGVLSFAQSYILTPYRVEQVEKRMEEVKIKASSDHDLLVEIATDIKYLKEGLSRTGLVN